MKYIKVCFVFMLVVANVGCVSMLSNDRKQALDVVFETKEEAIVEVTPIIKVDQGDFRNINIKKSHSPRLKNDSNVDYFEVVEIEGAKGAEFSINVHSICDCLGFRKWAVFAEPVLFTAEGEEVEIKKSLSSQNVYIKGSFPKTGIYRLLIIASTKYEGQQISKAVGYMGGVPAFSLPITVYPVGTVRISYN